MPKTKAERKLNSLYIDAKRAGGPPLRGHRSQRGVPILLADLDDATYSITFFASKGHFKVRWPWPSNGEKQEHRTFKSGYDLIEWFRKRGEEV